MKIELNQKSERQYYIDWLRIFLIFSVFLFHIGMIFNTWQWHIKNDVLYAGFLKDSMTFLHSWRMPLLFMLSGAGTWFALGKRTPGQYLKERFLRLFVPFIIGIFTLVPVQVYVEKIAGYNSIVDFYSHMFDGIYPSGNFSWHHLWFILYLFFIALLISPFLNFLRSGKINRFRQWCDSFFTNPLAPYIIIVPLVLSQVILRSYFETETHAFINDWASISYYIIFFIAGFFLLTSPKITESVKKYRILHLISAGCATVTMFGVAPLFNSESTGEFVYEFAKIWLAWSCALAASGYAKRYLNFNSRLRSLANEAIYPFYLLHQPVIVVTGYLIIGLKIPVMFKAVLVFISSFILIISIYWLLIRPFTFTRIIFGMKPLEKKYLTSQKESADVEEKTLRA